MIVLEDAPDSKVVRPQPRSRDVTADMTESSHLLPPPAYSSGSYRPNHTYDAPFQYPQDVIPPSQDRSPKGENASKRFVNAFVVAFVIWLLLAMLLETLAGFDVSLNVVKHKRKKVEPVKSPENSPDNRIRTARCIEGGEGFTQSFDAASSSSLYSTKMEFSLPFSPNLAFFGNDTYATGSFVIDTFESTSSDIEVDIDVSYGSPHALRRSKVCFLDDGKERSIGFMKTDVSDEPPSSANLMRYDIYVRLPVSKTTPLRISRLHADFLLLCVGITNLDGRVEFDEINIITGYKPIEVEHLIAHKARLETAHAEINGNFTVKSSLELVTKNAPMRVGISMQNAGTPSDSPTKLTLDNENSVIQAHLNLTNPLHVPGGRFAVNTATKNAHIIVDVAEQPVSSFLDIFGRSSSATIQVNLPPQFSGAFSLRSTVMRPLLEVLQLPRGDDPATAGRMREVEVTRQTPNSLEGDVTWMSKRGQIERGGGQVDLRTSILPAVLVLGGL